MAMTVEELMEMQALERRVPAMTPEGRAEVAEVLRAAARYLDAHGLTKGDLRSHGRVCAIGALDAVTTQAATRRAVAEDNTAQLHRYYLARRTLARYLGVPAQPGLNSGDGIPAWNDADQRTKRDVVAAMEKAAAWIEEEA